MNRQTTLSVPETCAESWNNMTPVNGGSFCGSCQKTVIDFTTMSDSQLLTYLQNRPQSVCGRFRPQQLKTYIIPEQTGIRPGYTLFRAGLISAFLLLVSKPGTAQSTTEKPKSSIERNTSQKKQTKNTEAKTRDITGTVTESETGQPIPGANIVIKGTANGTVADANGLFTLKNVNPDDIINISFIGYESKEYFAHAITSTNMALSLSMDLQVLGGVAIQEVYNEPTTGLGRMWARVKSIF